MVKRKYHLLEITRGYHGEEIHREIAESDSIFSLYNVIWSLPIYNTYRVCKLINGKFVQL